MDWMNHKVLVVGSGISGIGAATLLFKAGADPILYDENEHVSIEEITNKFGSGITVQVMTGALPEEMKEQVELVVISPGVPIDTPLVTYFKDKGIRIWGEIELAYALQREVFLPLLGPMEKQRRQH